MPGGYRGRSHRGGVIAKCSAVSPEADALVPGQGGQRSFRAATWALSPFCLGAANSILLGSLKLYENWSKTHILPIYQKAPSHILPVTIAFPSVFGTKWINLAHIKGEREREGGRESGGERLHRGHHIPRIQPATSRHLPSTYLVWSILIPHLVYGNTPRWPSCFHLDALNLSPYINKIQDTELNLHFRGKINV